MALRNKESAMNKMSRCRTRNLAPVHSRRGRECDCEFREGEDGRERGEREEEKRTERETEEKKEGDGRGKSRERERSRPWMEKRAESEIGVERR
ncbi:hypothetical protein TNCV_1842531 [Trichonephila clavipes]|nr:hypothetical protein TNCV_1842531 [Trichonephila clavipes]